ncbi:hypothetical protein ACFYRY_42555 [Streptomyces sp. NPDC005263]|uniref:hypothetical protein n=1 Tax=Streptomyces sp. NPDC005263 TaxID=3364711 RepID=UPI0036960F88
MKFAGELLEAVGSVIQVAGRFGKSQIDVVCFHVRWSLQRQHLCRRFRTICGIGHVTS